jgi:deoxyribonuclease-4
VSLASSFRCAGPARAFYRTPDLGSAPLSAFFMIRFGPAGIPLSCKGRTLRDGIGDVHHLGLTAMEVQFIKVNPLVRAAHPEEVNKVPTEIPNQLIVQVNEGSRDTPFGDPARLRAPLTRRSQITTLSWFLAKDYSDLYQAGSLARAVDVRLTLHAPYYVNLVSSPEARERSLKQYQWSFVLAQALGADMVVGHLGFYGPGDRADAVRKLTEEVRGLRQWAQDLGAGAIMFGVEPSGHPEVFGTREEILQLSRTVRGVRPVLNLPHILAREGMNINNRGALQQLIEEFLQAGRGELYLNFAGVETYGPGQFRLTPLKRGMLHFDQVAEVLADRDYDVTLISSSPLLEHDAMYMRLLYERALTKKLVRRPGTSSPGRVPPTRSPPAKNVRPARPQAPATSAPRSRAPAHRPLPSRARRPVHARAS